ncbi:hypothetical protein PPL_00393 [Heterostelium album PN500]|uniref:Uncharacterized protein n=1 Tax=Heterostelium pallidum (strain ATCC 26659 / Pp 5 / PN500) TaxID=670386 RepID=D3AWB9_HETP5|nr:hypothetical protein PPL_00393 [Heterostelium album PN500]EFA86592.1 hypothetical protein PPL_00393 [Heterostelium album PN500]|eukprot:XP_020438697.1 hypothetical protein PPL_00393 [Heterostelium album PN500]
MCDGTTGVNITSSENVVFFFFFTVVAAACVFSFETGVDGGDRPLILSLSLFPD